MSNLSVRILVSVVGIPLILLISMSGGFSFFGLIALISTIGLYEFYLLAQKKGALPQVATGLVFGLCVIAVFIHTKLQFAVVSLFDTFGIAIPFPSMAQMFLIVVLLFVPLILLVELFRNKGSALLNIGATIFGVCYVSLFMGTLLGLREVFVPHDFPMYQHRNVSPDEIYRWGGLTVIAVFASIWMCDSFAYFGGRLLGRHKLFPRVSPNKTWEGAVAGFVAAMGTFAVMAQIALPYLALANAIVCGGIVGIFGQLGDMAESLLKRDAGVKDSSSLIPGHGGVLDRFDSLLFVSPLIFLYVDFVVL